MNRCIVAVCAVLSLAACGRRESASGTSQDVSSPLPKVASEGTVAPDRPATDAEPSSVPGVRTHAAWLGRWRGVEGLNLVIREDAVPGSYQLEMQYGLEDKGVFRGTDTDEGIAFLRPDGPQVLRPTNGEETGLKWLEGKKDCLTVRDGEGYCRD